MSKEKNNTDNSTKKHATYIDEVENNKNSIRKRNIAEFYGVELTFKKASRHALSKQLENADEQYGDYKL